MQCRKALLPVDKRSNFFGLLIIHKRPKKILRRQIWFPAEIAGARPVVESVLEISNESPDLVLAPGVLALILVDSVERAFEQFLQ